MVSVSMWSMIAAHVIAQPTAAVPAAATIIAISQYGLASGDSAPATQRLKATGHCPLACDGRGGEFTTLRSTTSPWANRAGPVAASVPAHRSRVWRYAPETPSAFTLASRKPVGWPDQIQISKVRGPNLLMGMMAMGRRQGWLMGARGKSFHRG